MRINLIVFSLLSCAVLACSDPSHDKSESAAEIPFYDLPSSELARLPSLTKTASGNLMYSWVEERDSLTALFFSVYDGKSWTEKLKVDEGPNWFVNWADYPTVNDLGGGGLLAHYLQKSGEGTYAYDVKLLGSKDGGTTWGSAYSPHKDGTETEHGFVSILAVGSGQADVIWLDGRNYADGGSKNMTLRSARVDASSTISESIELDGKACDCCSTSLISSAGESIAYYRDRSDNEIRDISRVGLLSSESPMDVSRDGWEIAGCPVNGPKAVAANADLHAMAWFTAAENEDKVLVIFDERGIQSEPIRLDEGEAQGRVDLDWLDQSTLLVSWMESKEDLAVINLRTVGLDGELGEIINVAEVSAARGTGMPQLEIIDHQAYMAWTDVETKKIVLEQIAF